MKQINKIFILGILISMTLMSSCNIFQDQPVESAKDEQIWNNATLASLYLNDLYYLTLPSFSATKNTGYGDETYSDNEIVYGSLTMDDAPTVAASISSYPFTSATYALVRRINLFLENVGSGSIAKDTVEEMKAEAHFLRAWVYWNMVKLYGGIPMVMTVQQMSGGGELTNEMLVKRNKTSECVKMIAADLDTAISRLPAKWGTGEYGRATSAAAMSLKGIMYLFWASPQFNPNNDQTRWDSAYQINKRARTYLTANGYGLYSSFSGLFNTCTEQTKEAIFVRIYDPSTNYHTYDKSVRPLKADGTSSPSNAPTWELVQAFPMADGTPVDSSSTYNKSLFAYNRDPRFYSTIAYNSCYYPLGSDNSDLRIWSYYTWTVSNGDTTKVMENNYATPTGFFCKKYVNNTLTNDDLTKIGTDWMEIRYAEILLNLAECANEKGFGGEAYAALKEIRDRAGVGSDYIYRHQNDVKVMREIIMNERQVELAFENKRFWDLRRREMYTNDLGYFYKKLNGRYRNQWVILLKSTVSPDEMTSERDGLTDLIKQADITEYKAYFKSGYAEPLDTKYSIRYQTKYDFFPMPQTELDKNENLEQSKAWGGTFDPTE
jgi:starch-binding outer membrane protein, SusD/RagB family